MASEVLRISDVVIPEIYEQYLIEESIYKNEFYRAGIITRQPRFDTLVGGGGEMFNIPFWQQLTGDPQAIQSNTTIETKKTTTSKQVARRFMFGRGWSAEEIASALAGDSAMDAIESMVDDYWNRFFNGFTFSVVKGIMADNIDNDSSDLVNDITTSGTVAAANRISLDAVIDTAKKKGDKMQDFTAIAMHSTVYARALKNDSIDFIPDSQEGKEIEKYMGMRVIVDDGLAPDTDGSNSEYWTVLFQPGALGYGESGNNITVVETDRNAGKSEDLLYTRRQFTMHPRGWKWIDTSVAGDMPTKSEVEEAGNWDRVFEKKNCGVAVLISNG
ncbi:MAG: hypothetical protein JSW06_02675 [Thermoplasmatales archaeon]|nr:MAG: hypothetical protein JSW06_02675 [Thermoplasmatales archaeon]